VRCARLDVTDSRRTTAEAARQREDVRPTHVHVDTLEAVQALTGRGEYEATAPPTISMRLLRADSLCRPVGRAFPAVFAGGK